MPGLCARIPFSELLEIQIRVLQCAGLALYPVSSHLQEGIPSTAGSLSNFYPLERFLKVEFEVKYEKRFFQYSCHVLPKPPFKNPCHSGG